MKKFFKSKNGQWITGGILTALVLYIIFRHKVDSKVLEVSGKSDEWKAVPQSTLDGNKLLKKGSRGAEVTALQMLLKADGKDLGTFGPSKDGVDGVFGSVTEAALLSSIGAKETTLNKYRSSKMPVTANVKAGEMIYN